jgi:cob(I)alamin adenosyltransferase
MRANALEGQKIMGKSSKEQRHQNRMQRKKTVVDAAIEQADRDQGLVLVLTGNGKGKSSSAFGMVARALGHGMAVGVAQFIKGCSDTGEEAFFRNQPNVTWHVLGEGFTWETQNLTQDIETAQRGWAVAVDMLKDPSLGLVGLDELTYPLN